MARKKKNQKTRFPFQIIPVLVLSLYFLAAFWKEIRIVLRFWWWVFSAIPKILLGIDIGTMSRGPDLFQAQEILKFNLFTGFILIFIWWLFMAALQNLLPVSSLWEVLKTMRLVFYRFRGKKIRVARVEGGQNISSPEKLERKKDVSLISRLLQDEEDRIVKYERGIIILDSNSAAVLEEMSAAPDLIAVAKRLILTTLCLIDDASPRICGPGLTFIRPSERVHSFVDLRKQIRGENGVVATTADGIDISTYVFSVFSLGRNPKTIQLAFNEGNDEKDLQVVILETEPGKKVRVKKFEDSLDKDDRQEAYNQVWPPRKSSEFGSYFTPDDPGIKPEYDRDRVFGAVFARAQDDDSDSVVWHELPLIFTKDAFKEMTLQFTMDKLSNPDGPSKVADLKARVNDAIRNQCVLPYSVVCHRSGEPLKAGEVYDQDDLRSTPKRFFSTSRVLRDRGIMNIYSAFTMLTPVDDRIYQQRLDNWQARLQREIDLAVTKHEVEVRNIISRARIQAQEEVASTLNSILGDRMYSEEAMALLLFQALEEYISNPETRKRLPNEVITLLRNVQDRILPAGSGGFPFLRD